MINSLLNRLKSLFKKENPNNYKEVAMELITNFSNNSVGINDRNREVMQNMITDGYEFRLVGSYNGKVTLTVRELTAATPHITREFESMNDLIKNYKVVENFLHQVMN